VHHFNASNFLTLCQVLLSLVFLFLLKTMEIISYPDFQTKTAYKLLLLGASFTSMVVTGLAAMIFVSIPMLTALRRLTTLIVIAVQFFMTGKRVSNEEFLAVLVMVLGAMVASVGDLTFHLWGYFLVFMNCCTTAWYLVTISKSQQDTQLNSFGLMFYNNLFSIPILLVTTPLFELHILVNYDHWKSTQFLIALFISCTLAFVLNYLIFLCSIVNSPLTTSITGQLKAIVSTILGLFMFGDVIVTPILVVGLTVSTLAGVWYGSIKYQQQVARLYQIANPVVTQP